MAFLWETTRRFSFDGSLAFVSNITNYVQTTVKPNLTGSN